MWQPMLTNRPLGVPDAVAPVSPMGMSAPSLVHGRARLEET